ncbi:(2Fe-2S)-binding protein [Colwellia sp. 1_MG-2023]|uniref:(2Fe-2S)-binding protein n=1 Tax=unclassified Colwellia TaxID=196834 RepID=UPI001C089502|nr:MULTISPECIES: (2Fe-2S)-binding protein [unclassified Colwellia]MBU2924272.1 (2Fe-2S)-binding protein [Colwellia sp. C2M11]MDO6652981.1 (2Fe-2S)-binding protein [Colwellia sp. 3_MG-2023]MDO6665463.1 (2Fe-2S)-binding protein [Colwellia sp. 2_MG-2023]MDO6689778.1 (2Fe-2S)-binding protein [Colwellia sp. 1_MG-2023]
MIKFKVNNEDVSLDVAEEMPLLYAIRDELQLTGTKFGCGAGQCGACTVHIDGVAMRSCITPVSYAANKKITTIEGLDPENNHSVQISWREYKVPQCGYCQVGQIMSAAAMLIQNKAPTDDDIDTAMQGNICRCGTYVRIKKAIKHAAMLNKEKTVGEV